MAPNMKKHDVRFLICAFGLIFYAATGVQRVLCQPSTAERTRLAFPGQYLDSLKHAPSGEIAYLLRVKFFSAKIKNVPLDLIIQMTGESVDAHKPVIHHITSTQAYPYATQFSPSGKWILVQTAFPQGAGDAYQLQFWDRARSKMQVGPTTQAYPLIRSSPDSRYLAYFQGGDEFGEQTHGAAPLQLHVYNLETKQSQLISENPEVKSFCWTNQHSLLYAFKPSVPLEMAPPYHFHQPSIYESVLGNNSAKLLIPAGFDPVSSPNGRWIAFKGWFHPALKKGPNPKTEPQRFGLCLYDRHQKHRFFLHILPQRGAYENLVWSADSAHLFAVQNVYHDTHPAMLTVPEKTIYPGYAKGYVRDISIPAFSQRDIAVISASDASGRDDPQNQFLFHSVSKNGKFLYIYVNELRQFYHSRLLSINIHTGASQIVLEGDGIQAVGWREIPPLTVPLLRTR